MSVFTASPTPSYATAATLCGILLATLLCLNCAGPQSNEGPTDANTDSADTTQDSAQSDGSCLPVCEGKFCGPDGCGGTCPDICDGICNPDTGACSTETQCEPDCTNKACGDDGCGGECPDLCEGVCNEQTGTCDDERTPVNGCTSEADEHIYEFQNVNQSALVCMTESDNNPAEATTCLGNETGLTPACQECWSGFFHCVFEDCVASCATDPGDDGCGQCHQSTCLSAYETCAGRSMDWN